jgi:hypothetical protein
MGAGVGIGTGRLESFGITFGVGVACGSKGNPPETVTPPSATCVRVGRSLGAFRETRDRIFPWSSLLKDISEFDGKY